MKYDRYAPRSVRASLHSHALLDMHPSAAASDLVSFGGSNDGELDDNLSLAASDVEDLSGSYHDLAPCILRSPAHPAHAWTPIFSASCLMMWRSWVWNGFPKRKLITYSSRIRASSSSALTSVNGMEEKGYDSPSPLDESVAAHLCMLTVIGWKAKAAKPIQTGRSWTSLFIGWTSGLGASLHSGPASVPGETPPLFGWV